MSAPAHASTGGVFATPGTAALHSILDQLALRPADHLCRRLRADGGKEWFDAVVSRAVATLLTQQEGENGSASDPEVLLALKELGKQYLRDARLTEEIEEATAVYFAAVVLLLAECGYSRLADVCTLPVIVVEDVLIALVETLDGEWSPRVARALRFID